MEPNSLLSTFQNQYGIPFHVISVPINQPKNYFNTFLCQFCNHILLTKNGAKKHNCQSFKRNKITENYTDRHVMVMHYILRYIATSNIPFRAADSEFLRNALSILDPTFILPGKDKLLSEMITLSNDIQNNTYCQIRGRVVSLLFDSCQLWGKHYQGIVIHTPQRLYLYSVLPTANSRASTFSDLIANVVEHLSYHKTTICCDNARANVKAFSNRGLIKKKLNILRQPCSAHTGNLAIHDMFEKDEIYGFIIEEVKSLMKNIDHAPRLLTIRWDSLFDCVSYIIKHYQKINQNSNIADSLKKIEDTIGWEQLHDLLAIMDKFIKSVEKDLATISDVGFHFLIAYNRLIEMNTPASLKLSEHFKIRFMKKNHLRLPLFAFLMTQAGLQYFRSNPNSADFIKGNAIAGIKEYMKNRGIQSPIFGHNIDSFQKYLSEFSIDEFTEFRTPIEMWKNLSQNNQKSDFPIYFIHLIIEVLQIPASEAPVERIFSALSRIARSETKNVTPQTLNSRLIVRFDTIFSEAGSVFWEDLLENPTHAFKLDKYP